MRVGLCVVLEYSNPGGPRTDSNGWFGPWEGDLGTKPEPGALAGFCLAVPDSCVLTGPLWEGRRASAELPVLRCTQLSCPCCPTTTPWCLSDPWYGWNPVCCDDLGRLVTTTWGGWSLSVGGNLISCIKFCCRVPSFCQDAACRGTPAAWFLWGVGKEEAEIWKKKQNLWDEDLNKTQE